jgi:hypothetical protein
MKRVELTVLISPELADRITKHVEGCAEPRSTVVARLIERGLTAEGAPSTKEKRRAMLREIRDLEFVVKTLDKLHVLDVLGRRNQ